jgi:hypothetical protein
MLQLYFRHDFYKSIFKIKHKLYIASVSATRPPVKNSGCLPIYYVEERCYQKLCYI